MLTGANQRASVSRGTCYRCDKATQKICFCREVLDCFAVKFSSPKKVQPRDYEIESFNERFFRVGRISELSL